MIMAPLSVNNKWLNNIFNSTKDIIGNNNDTSVLEDLDSSILSMVVLFGSIVVTTVALLSRFWGNTSPALLFQKGSLQKASQTTSSSNNGNGVNHPHNQQDADKLSSFLWICRLCFNLSLLGILLWIIFMLEHYPPHPHLDRRMLSTGFDMDNLLFLGGIAFLLSLLSLTPNKKTDRWVEYDPDCDDEDEDEDVDDEASIETGLPTIVTQNSNQSYSTASSDDMLDFFQVNNREQTTCVRHNMNAASSNNSKQPTKTTIQVHTHHNSLNQHDPVGLLNPHQSLEMRGFLSIALLLYQLANVELSAEHELFTRRQATSSGGESNKADSINALIALICAAKLGASLFIFLSAYGHAMHFYCRHPPIQHHVEATHPSSSEKTTIGRICHVVFRLNALALLLSCWLGQTYTFYYACPLHTFVFITICAVMQFFSPHSNYTKWGLRIKLFLLAGFFFLVWDFQPSFSSPTLFLEEVGQGSPFDAIFAPIFPPRGEGDFWTLTKTFGKAEIQSPLDEWYYHTHLHHWVIIVGIIFAVNYPVSSLLLKKTERQSKWNPSRSFCIKSIVGLSMLAVAIGLPWFIWLPHVAPKNNDGTTTTTTGKQQTSLLDLQSIHSTHAYIAFCPILCLVYFRNLTRWMRRHHLSLLKSIGTCSLEIFVLHHHIFLSNGGQAILMLLPGYPKCNALLTGVVLIAIAKAVHAVTSRLGSLLFCFNHCGHGSLLKSGFVIATFVVLHYGLSTAFDALELPDLNVAIILSTFVIGFVLYLVIVSATWRSDNSRLLDQKADQNSGEASFGSKMSMVGILIIFTITMIWNISASFGAESLLGPSPLLPAFCNASVNEGIWTPVNTCINNQRGRLMRQYGHYPACATNENDSTTMHWGWRTPTTRQQRQCPFRSRSIFELQHYLKNYRIIFIGDPTVRNLFHAFCRALGDASAGNYDASVGGEHSDIVKAIGNVRVEYKSSPLVMDQVNKLRDLRYPDHHRHGIINLLVMGGGVMDQLHLWATDEDPESNKVQIEKLAREMNLATFPIAWCTPTTINTAALGTTEKREYMSEYAMSQVRTLYDELNVLGSADFVLDGPSYSQGRASESQDGVLYPQSVYDTGIQIMANALDWILPLDENNNNNKRGTEQKSHHVDVGTTILGGLGNTALGLMMLFFCMIGIAFFDGYIGFWYLSSLWTAGCDQSKQWDTRNHSTAISMPSELYHEAFSMFHRQWNLPRVNMPSATTLEASSPSNQRAASDPPAWSSRSRISSHGDILSLLDEESVLQPKRKIRNSVARNRDVSRRSKSCS